MKLDPRDADSLYFEGACYQEMKQFDKAIAAFEKALEIEPAARVGGVRPGALAAAHGSHRGGEGALHAISTFDEHKDFIGAGTGLRRAGTLLDGDGGGRAGDNRARYDPGAAGGAADGLPVSKSRPGAPTAFTTTGGACMMDVTGSGKMDLVLMQSGAQAIRVLHNRGGGSFEELDAAAAGLKADGHAVACAVGDYDGDGLNDLAVALDDRVLLFRNLGHGKFENVTAQAGLVPRNRPTGITFVDYDHDGDLDLLLTGAPLQPGGESNVLWRNNGNRTFTEQTEQTGLGGSGKTAAAILTDFNNDRAVDLAVTGDGPSP